MKKFIFLCFEVFSILFVLSCNSISSNIKNIQSNDTMVVDIDGNIYHVIKIGNQIWLKENLKVTHFRNGDPIPNITDDSDWATDIIGAYCNYNNDTSLVHIYGRLYNWYAVNDKRGICPKGWHVPSSDEFSDLDYMFGGAQISGMQLKEAGRSHWNILNEATNASNFTALPGGHRDIDGFSRIGFYAYFWNKDEYLGENCAIDNECAHECSLNYRFSYFLQDWGFKRRGMSIRCIKDTIKNN